MTARWRIGGDVAALRADPGFAGAISSIAYRGREYLDASDHGREMQGAVQFGFGECLNPTLAGASRDRLGATTSRLLAQAAGPSGYRSTTRMAFWDRPGQRCTLGPDRKGATLNTERLSDLVYSQDMRPGYRGRPHAVLDRVTIASSVPRPPASAEVLTAYLPPAFDTFLVYDPSGDRFLVDRALEETSSERSAPVIVSTADGSAAMGVVGLGGEGRLSYDGYRGPQVSKWSLIYRASTAFRPGRHRYAGVWAIGTRREVENTLLAFIADDRVRYGPELAATLAVLAALLAAWFVWQLRRQRRGERLEPIGPP